MVWVRIPFAPNYQAHQTGKVRNAKTKRVLNPHVCLGYRRVNLYIDGAKKIRRVSHCVLAAFVADRPPGHTADHIDPGKKMDDSLHNLRWASAVQQAQNQRKIVRNARRIPIIRTEPCGKETRYESAQCAAKATGLWGGNISACANKGGKAGDSTWRWEDSPPDLPNEEWTPHPVHTKIAFSNLGRVRDSRHVYVTKRHAGDYRTTREQEDKSYPRIGINGEKYYIHVLVAETFLGEKPPGHKTGHVNGDRSDIRPENLYYRAPLI